MEYILPNLPVLEYLDLFQSSNVSQPHLFFLGNFSKTLTRIRDAEGFCIPFSGKKQQVILITSRSQQVFEVMVNTVAVGRIMCAFHFEDTIEYCATVCLSGCRIPIDNQRELSTKITTSIRSSGPGAHVSSSLKDYEEVLFGGTILGSILKQTNSRIAVSVDKHLPVISATFQKHSMQAGINVEQDGVVIAAMFVPTSKHVPQIVCNLYPATNIPIPFLVSFIFATNRLIQ